MFLVVPCLHSCLITDKIDLADPVNHRPSVISQPRAIHPTTQIIEIDLTSPEAPTFIALEVTVRDANLYQRLEYRVLVDENRLAQDGENDPLGPNADPATEDRNIVGQVDVGSLLNEAGCHRIDFVVSSEFVDFNIATPREPVEEGDFAIASWFVRTVDTAMQDIDLNGCPRVTQ